jgi:hypothetical protein
MTYYEDLSPCLYFGEKFADKLVAVGWLDLGKNYRKGDIDKEVTNKLVELLVNPWQPFVAGGWHECPFCRISTGPRRLEHKGSTIEMGANNLFIPSNGFLYVAPSLIVHYIDAHEYSPPKAFCEVMLKCPSMRSIEYLRAIATNGPKEFVLLKKRQLE